MKRLGVVLMFAFFSLQFAIAGNEDVSNRIRLYDINATVNNVLQCKDNKYTYMATAGGSSQWDFKDLNAYALIKVYVDSRDIPESGNYKLKVETEVTGEYYDQVTEGFQTMSVQNIDFEINQSVDGSNAKDQELKIIPNAYGVSVKVNKISKFDSQSNSWIVLYDWTNLLPVPKNVYLEIEQHTERYYKAPASNSFDWFSGATVIDYDQDAIADDLEIHWTSVSNAEEYELEWQFINNYSDTWNQFLADNQVEYNFKNGTTKIRIKNNYYKMPMLFDNGFVVWRIRGIWKSTTGSNYDDVYSEWSTTQTSGLVSSLITLTSTFYTPVTQRPNHTQMVWQSVATYAEEGKNKMVVNFLDGTLRKRQAVTKENTNEDVLVSETIYDYQGRPAVEVLPVPSFQKQIQYYSSFNKNNASPNVQYSKSDFDIDASGCSSQPGIMSNTSGAGLYYSPLNPDKNILENGSLPNANGYPFVLTEWESDNTGRVRSKSGIGQNMMPSIGKYTSYLYDQPTQFDLNRLFYTEVGNNKHYQKNTVIDPNGQASVSYLNMQGKVVASSLSGNPSSDMDPVTGNTNVSFSENVNLPDYTIMPDNNTLVYSKVFSVTGNNIPYSFNYQITGGNYIESCLSQCLECNFDVEITLTENQCGTNVVPPVNYHIGERTACQPQDSVWPNVTSAVLNTGTYTYTKIVKLDEQALAYYTDLFMNTAACIPKVNDVDVDTSGCDVSCDSCYARVGTFEEYSAKMTAQLGTGAFTETELHLQYDLLIKQCDEYCIPPSPCDILYQSMLTDVSKGGQYGEFLDLTTGQVNPEVHKLSVFNEYNKLPWDGVSAKPNWRNPEFDYSEDDGSLSYVPVINGFPEVLPGSIVLINGEEFVKPQNLKNVQDFLSAWKTSWAKSLVKYHPEYCYYEWCGYTDEVLNNNPRIETSNKFDSFLRSVTEVNQLTSVITSGDEFLNLLNADPMFNSSFGGGNTICPNVSSGILGQSTNARDLMLHYLNNYQKIQGTWRDISQAAYIAVKCPYSYYSNIAASLNCTIPQTVVIDDEIVVQYLSFYLDCKEKVRESLADCYALNNCNKAGYNGCIGVKDFNPFTQHMVPPTCDINFWYQYLPDWYFDWFNPTITVPSACNSLLDKYLVNSNNCQPCKAATYDLYASKMKRFPKHSDDLINGKSGDDEDPVTTANNLMKEADYNHYQLTGQCPIARDLEILLNNMAQNNKLSTSNIILNTVGSFTKYLYDVINPVGASNQTTEEIKWINLGTSNLLADIEFQKGSTALKYVKLNSMSLNITASDVKNITRLRFLSVNGSDYTFEFEADVMISGALQHKYLTGVTNIDIQNCSGISDPICKTNAVAKNIQSILNVFVGKLKAGGLNQAQYYPFNSSEIPMVKMGALEHLLGQDNDLSWKYSYDPVAETYFFYVKNNTTGFEIKITLGDIETQIIPTTSYRFSNIKATNNIGEFLVKSRNTVKNNTIPITYTTTYTTKNGMVELIAPVSVSLELKDCDPPLSFDCKTQDHKNVKILEKYLNSLAKNNILYASNPIELIPGLTFTQDLRQAFNAGKKSSWTNLSYSTSLGEMTSVLNDPDIASSLCKFELKAYDITTGNPTTLDYAQVTGITDVSPWFSGSNTFDATKFFTAVATTSASTTVKIQGSSCLNLRECTTCPPGSKWYVEKFKTTFDNGQDFTSDFSYEIPVNNEFQIITNNTVTDTFCKCHINYVHDGNMLNTHIVSTPSVGKIFWKKRLPVSTDKTYRFSFWAKKCTNEASASLRVQVGSTEINQNITLSATWTMYSLIYKYTGTDEEVDFSIIARDINQNVCDISLDDIKLELEMDCGIPSLVLDTIPELDCPCVNYMIDVAKLNTSILQQAVNDSIRNAFRHNYHQKCMSALESLVISARNNEYQFTLYYYDQAGNLVRTVPPAGVVTVDDNTSIQNINTCRNNNTQYTPAINHTLATTYTYNTLNQVSRQTTPDGGTSYFWYDELGRLVASQNEKQRPNNLYTYTLFDNLGRVIETGQANNFWLTYNNCFVKYYDFVQSVNSASRTEITRTFYDEPVVDWTTNTSIDFSQENLIKRVATVAVYQLGTDAIDQYKHATHYSYDIHGNVESLVQDYPLMSTLTSENNRYKRINYEYDLVSGKVNKVIYQPKSVDQFIHRYEYDADNKITHVFTSRDGIIWEKDAKYFYYKHGPLARVELGDIQVQGIDYAYTLQGWIKGINSNILNPELDLGRDNNNVANNLHKSFASDASSFSLGYFDGDYAAINTNYSNFIVATNNIGTGYYAPNLYNGNISHMVSTVKTATGTFEPQLTAYRYDQLNRLTTMRANYEINSSNTWQQNGLLNDKYLNTFAYDANGNITFQARNYQDPAKKMDVLGYRYETDPVTNRLLNNKLQSVADGEQTPNDLTDIEQGQVADNYQYDAIGNLVKDKSEKIDNINWNLGGKMREIVREVAPNNPPHLAFEYDAMGNRVCKIEKPNGSYNGNGNDWTYTFYIRDAQGNIMATYSRKTNDSYMNLEELELYGSSRLGVKQVSQQMGALSFTSETGNNYRVLGLKQYELSNHLGNVLSVISDQKLPQFNAGALQAYKPVIVSSQDYYPFGMVMKERSSNLASNGYRFGFNGKENDNEVMGDGNWQDYGMRMYNPRIGRFPNVDPLTKQYPFYTPYQFAGNKPIMAVDLDGEEERIVIYVDKGDGKTLLLSKNWSDIYPGQECGPMGNTGTATGIINTFANDRDTYSSMDIIYTYLEDNKVKQKNIGNINLYDEPKDNWIEKLDKKLEGSANGDPGSAQPVTKKDVVATAYVFGGAFSAATGGTIMVIPSLVFGGNSAIGVGMEDGTTPVGQTIDCAFNTTSGETITNTTSLFMSLYGFGSGLKSLKDYNKISDVVRHTIGRTNDGLTIGTSAAGLAPSKENDEKPAPKQDQR